jgi:xanthine dehydrogenase/oxidase
MECNVDDKEEEKKIEPATSLCCSSSLDKVKLTQETMKEGWLDQPNLIFPKDLIEEDSSIAAELVKPLVIVDKSEYHSAGTWMKPSTLVDLLGLLKDFGGVGEGGCKIVVGNTEVGIEARFKHAVYPRLIAPSESIESLFSFKATPTTIEIGSCTPLSTIQHECELLSDDPMYGRTVKPIHDMLRWFASTQIRNVACLGGNLVTASPISDMNPMLASMGGQLVISSIDEDGTSIAQRRVPVSDFFLSYRKVDLKSTELVELVEVPVLNPSFEYLKPFKQARRREDDISIVTAGMKIRLEVAGGKWTVAAASLAFGGMAPKTVMAKATMEFLEGKEFCTETFAEAQEVLLQELQLPYDVPGGQATYRMTLAASFLYMFFVSAVDELRVDVEKLSDQEYPPIPVLSESEATAAKTFVDAKKPSIRGTQKYPEPKFVKGVEENELPKIKEMPAGANAKEDAVGKASTHMSGPLHCTGEALYTDDIPISPSTLQAVLILASECGGILESIDIESALAIEGVVGAFTHKDLCEIGGYNYIGPIQKDEFVFVPIGEKVTTVGQVLGIVVGESLEVAELGARAVVVKYGKPEGKILVSIEDAISAGSFYHFARHTMSRGDSAVLDSLEAKSSEDPKPGDTVTVEGSFMCAGQEHFYLETNTSLVVPSDSDTNLTIYCSTQAATKTQNYCASATGTPASKVVVRVKRMGGGFGGKETRSGFATCAAAVAAKITCRPVRLTLARDVDMSITGTRHAFVAKYKASAIIKEDGTVGLHALDVKLYNNGGYSFDLSGPVLDRALFHVDGCYYWPHFRAVGDVCKTSQPSHTAYRGFGAPQGIATVEHILDHLAVECKVSVDSIRRTNMYFGEQSTPFGMILTETKGGKWNVPMMWDRMFSDANVIRRREEIEQFNAGSKWVKRGLCLVPTKVRRSHVPFVKKMTTSLLNLFNVS